MTENRVDYVRLTMAPGLLIGHVLPEVVPEERALKEIQKCRLSGADDMNANGTPPEKSASTSRAPDTAPNPTTAAP